ncbi:MAG: hypothetical protein ABSA32_05895 [Candidatus Acidiferrales bacterium]|jgi:hypothetical protein
MAISILDLLNVERELTLEFFATFARFEFALKQAGYVRGDERGALPDWDAFARDLARLDASFTAGVLDSCKYLLQHPPKKQIVAAGRLQWVDQRESSGSAIGDVIRSLRIVRNNVFHGGKFPDGPIVEPLRDEALIRDCLAVFERLLDLPLPRDVARIFRGGM